MEPITPVASRLRNSGCPNDTQNPHPGNDGSSQPTITRAKLRIRTYHTSCSTFLDLVDESLPTDWQGKQRLRLRAGSRSLGPPLVYTDKDRQRLIRAPSDVMAQQNAMLGPYGAYRSCSLGLCFAREVVQPHWTKGPSRQRCIYHGYGMEGKT
jgi:hypothetical protein